MRWPKTLAVPLIAALGLAAACGGDSGGAPPTVTPSPAATPAAVDTSAWLTYQDAAHGFELHYPRDGQIHKNAPFAVPFASDQEIGTQIDLPLLVLGTALLEKYVFIEAGERPAAECERPELAARTGDAIPDGVAEVRLNGVHFWKTDALAGAAGIWWRAQSYQAANGTSCVVLQTVMLGYNPAIYADPPPAYDRAAETAIFDEILATFRWLE